jgi:hypothetical protein
VTRRLSWIRPLWIACLGVALLFAARVRGADVRVADLCKAVVEDPNYKIRVQAALVLGKVRDASAVP